MLATAVSKWCSNAASFDPNENHHYKKRPSTKTASTSTDPQGNILQYIRNLLTEGMYCQSKAYKTKAKMQRMIAAILLISGIGFGVLVQLTHARHEGDTMHLNITGVHKRTEWPEMLHKNMSAIFTHFLETLGANFHPEFAIFLQKPLPSQQKRPLNEDDSDVWLYLTHDDIVYEIPRHGRWHPNRINPGWPELKGVHYKDAIRVIMNDMPGVHVDYGPLKRRKPKGTKINRVVLYIDDGEKVARIPTVG